MYTCIGITYVDLILHSSLAQLDGIVQKYLADIKQMQGWMDVVTG